MGVFLSANLKQIGQKLLALFHKIPIIYLGEKIDVFVDLQFVG